LNNFPSSKNNPPLPSEGRRRKHNKKSCELTVLSNCALVAPHFNAIAIPY